jgi:hypothetical protein
LLLSPVGSGTIDQGRSPRSGLRWSVEQFARGTVERNSESPYNLLREKGKRKETPQWAHNRTESYGPLDFDSYLPVPRVDQMVFLVDPAIIHDVHQVYVHMPQRFLKAQCC